MNLFAEPVPEHQGEPMPVADYPTPGSRLLGTIGTGPIRGIRQSVTGGVYVVSGDTVYSVDPTSWAGTALGTITGGLRTPVSMADNGLDMVIVDGSANGWHVTLAGNAFAQIDNSAGTFYGADKVDYLDTYLLFNKPQTPQFYSSDSLALTFDPLWFANKESYSDLLVTLAVAKREIWLFGSQTTEIWFNSGKPDFPFESMPGIFIDHGCVAKYSVANYDNSVFWLTADRQGRGIVIMGAKYETKRISTYAIEAEIAGYERISDAIGFCYQLAGHTFYVLTFPRADKTWVHDITTGLWHEWLWIDANGDEHRHRANCYWPVNGVPVVGDWQNGNLYALDQDVFTDNGLPIKRVRSYPHILNDGKRVFYRQFLADLETGWAPEMLAGTQTRLQALFTAANGTNLSAYISDVGGGWTAVGGAANAQIADDTLVGTGGAQALYQSAAAILTPDYTLHFDVVPPVAGEVVADTSVWVIGRAAGASAGYRAAVSADGTQYTLTLSVLPSGTSASVAMGTIASGFFTVWLLLRGANITAQVQRSRDHMWLRTDGTWHTDPGTIAAQFTDATYTEPGTIMIGGVWPALPPPAGLTATYETPLATDPNFPGGYVYYSTVYGIGYQTFDFTRNLYYAAINNSVPTVGIAITDLSAMQVTRTVTVAQMYAGTAYGSSPGVPWSQDIWDIVCGNGTALFLMTGPSNIAPHFTRVDPVTMKVTGEFSGFLDAPHDGAVNKTATHIIVAYTGTSTITIFDGTNMALVGSAGSSVGATVPAPAAMRGDGSCDFIVLHPGAGSGDIDIHRINVTDGLAISNTTTGTVNILSVFTPSPQLFLAPVPVNYDTAHDAIIMWLSNEVYGPPTYLLSVNWNGSIRWSLGPFPDGILQNNRGQSLLTGTTLMAGNTSDLKLIDTSTGAITFTGSVPGLSDYLFHAWDASRQSYWTYSVAVHGFTRIDLPVPSGTLLAMDNLTATAQQTLLSTNLISLRWSDDRGHAYGSPVTQDIGAAGEYRTSLQWQRLAYARDRIFELSWSVPMRTALQGAWIDVTPAQS